MKLKYRNPKCRLLFSLDGFPGLLGGGYPRSVFYAPIARLCQKISYLLVRCIGCVKSALLNIFYIYQRHWLLCR